MTGRFFSMGLWAIGLSILATMPLVGQPSQSSQQQKITFLQSSDLQWNNAKEPLPAGAKMAVLEGNPKESGPFTIRLRFPANYDIAPHVHSGLEHVSVLKGSLHLGTDNTVDKSKGTEVSAYGFVLIPAGTVHYAWTTEETEIQLHGMGPWELHYVDQTKSK